MEKAQVATTVTSGGMSVSTLLTIVFVVLKLIGVINWSWVWVLAPLWISALLSIAIIIICVILGIIFTRHL